MTTLRRIILSAILVSVLMEHGSSVHSFQTRSFDYSDFSRPGEVFNLSLISMAALPNDVVILGGSYWNSTGPIHSCLLISRDGGKSWKEQDLKFVESGISKIQTYGKRSVWGIVINQKEGVADPQYLLISNDAGLTWQQTSISALGPRGFRTVELFRFFDAQHGIISISNTAGRGALLQTSDSGRSWQLLWNTNLDIDVESDFVYPQADPPLHATLWQRKGEYDKALAVLRIWSNPANPSDPYLIQRLGTDWETISVIGRGYVVKDGALTPSSDK